MYMPRCSAHPTPALLLSKDLHPHTPPGSTSQAGFWLGLANGDTVGTREETGLGPSRVVLQTPSAMACWVMVLAHRVIPGLGTLPFGSGFSAVSPWGPWYPLRHLR